MEGFEPESGPFDGCCIASSVVWLLRGAGANTGIREYGSTL